MTPCNRFAGLLLMADHAKSRLEAGKVPYPSAVNSVGLTHIELSGRARMKTREGEELSFIDYSYGVDRARLELEVE